MSDITQDQRDRFEAALQIMEAAAAKHQEFLNSPIGQTVATDAGPVKSLPTLANDVDVLGVEVGETLVEIAAHLDTLVV